MVFPGVVRRAMKMMPTVIQALALVVFIHVIGQVSNKLIVIYHISNTISVISTYNRVSENVHDFIVF